MSEFTIQCMSCEGSFASENDYSEHQCTGSDIVDLAADIKEEPIECENPDEINFEVEEDTVIEGEENDPLFLNNEHGLSESLVDDPGLLNLELDEAEIQSPVKSVDTLKDEELSVMEWSRTIRRTGNATPDHTYSCKICGSNFPSKEMFKNHFTEQHKTFKPHECGVCFKKFLHKHYVNLHMRVHTGEKPYVCKLCPRAYSHKTSFTIHMRIHNGIRPYSCTVCNKKCYDKSGLTSHMRSHTKETPYMCEVCGRRFTHSKSLLVHRRNHTGEKPYTCSYCGKAFRHWHKHKIHVRLHTGERPYKCKICGKGFPRNDEVSRHMKSHQGIKSFKCSICGVYCATQASITGHIDLHHSNLKDEFEPPEKTFVENSNSGILGTKVPEPRAVYLAKFLESQASSSKETNPVSSKNKMQTEVQTTKQSAGTHVIEITSKDTPITPSKHPKIPAKLNCVLPKPSISLNTGDKKFMSYDDFLSWQEDILTKQGLIKREDSTTENTNDNILQNNQNTSDYPPNKRIKIENDGKSISSNKPQFILVNQGGNNANKILFPINMLSQNFQQKASKNSETPSGIIAPQVQNKVKSNTSGTSMQSIFIVSNGSQKLLLIPSQVNQSNVQQNEAKEEEQPTPIKTEPEDDLDASLETVIKTEKEDFYFSATESLLSPEIEIKEEPKDF